MAPKPTIMGTVVDRLEQRSKVAVAVTAENAGAGEDQTRVHRFEGRAKGM